MAMEFRVFQSACSCGQDHGPAPHVAEIIARAAREHTAPPAQPQPEAVPRFAEPPDTLSKLMQHFSSTLLRDRHSHRGRATRHRKEQ